MRGDRLGGFCSGWPGGRCGRSRCWVDHRCRLWRGRRLGGYDVWRGLWGRSRCGGLNNRLGLGHNLFDRLRRGLGLGLFSYCWRRFWRLDDWLWLRLRLWFGLRLWCRFLFDNRLGLWFGLRLRLADETLTLGLAAQSVGLCLDNARRMAFDTDPERVAEVNDLGIRETKLSCKFINPDFGCHV